MAGFLLAVAYHAKESGGDYLKSYGKVASLSSISIHSSNQQVGEMNTKAMILNGSGKNAFPQIAGAIIYALRNKIIFLLNVH